MHNYFSITAGRTGSAWLTDFLSENLNIEAVHEPLGVNDFGEKMPDIRTMRNFNNFGNNDFVKDFWKRKFASIPNGTYAETNHTLSKCGLVENIVLNEREENTTLIVLKRNIVKQCVSYLVRNDFGNITLAWQWYLHPTYIKKLVNPQGFMKLGNASLPLWYCYEMAARQEYYRQKFSDKIKMIDLTLEEAITETGAKSFYSELGFDGDFVMPPPKNENKAKPSRQLVESVESVVGKIKVDMPQLVRDAIKNGFAF
ncbi:hypothetical protein [Thalassospira lucentensis]|uniref:hypothetical protein n=1 Tax=Thalassospira lucentensis TaxID=168935 RepID=UPI00399D5EA0